MNLPKFALEHKPIVGAIALLLFAWGLTVFLDAPRREDPEFTIREAVITTDWPGATARQVEELVTDKIEIAAANIDMVRRVQSTSMVGRSVVQVVPTVNARSWTCFCDSATTNRRSTCKLSREGSRLVGARAVIVPPGAGHWISFCFEPIIAFFLDIVMNFFCSFCTGFYMLNPLSLVIACRCGNFQKSNDVTSQECHPCSQFSFLKIQQTSQHKSPLTAWHQLKQRHH